MNTDAWARLSDSTRDLYRQYRNCTLLMLKKLRPANY